MPEDGPGGAGLGGVAARLEGMLEDTERTADREKPQQILKTHNME